MSVGTPCDAAMRPFPDDTEVRCHGLVHLGEHEAILRDYAYPGSQTKISWFEDDRRTFHGEWPGPCEKLSDGAPPCTLPAGHRGNCAP